MISIEDEHADFQQVQYQLQRMLGLSSNIAGLNVWRISTEIQVDAFNAHTATVGKKPEILECFHPITDRGALTNQTKMHQYIANIQSDGIPFPENASGVSFVHGALPDDTPTDSPLVKKDSFETDNAQDEETKNHVDVVEQRKLVVDELNGSLSRKDEDDVANTTGSSTTSTCTSSSSAQPLPSIRAYMIVSVLTGRPGSFPTKESIHHDSMQLPKGYDTICYPSKSHIKDSSEDDEQIIAPYQASFRTFEKNGVVPRYLVTFEREGVEGGVKQLFCDMCSSTLAEVYCRHEDANLCRDCDKEVHCNKLLAKHKRVPLRCSNDAETLAAGGNNNLEIFKSKCPFHNNMDVEFFCPECDVPVCIYCKMVGSHSTGAFNNHRLIGVRVAWKKAIDEASVPDQVNYNNKNCSFLLLSLSAQPTIAFFFFCCWWFINVSLFLFL